MARWQDDESAFKQVLNEIFISNVASRPQHTRFYVKKRNLFDGRKV